MFEIGGDGDSRGAARIFLMRARYKAQNPPTTKISFLLEFRSLYFGNVKKSKKMEKNGHERIQVPDPFPLTLVGDDIGRSLMVNNIFSCYQRTACCWKHDFLIRDLVILWLSDPPQIVYPPNLGDFSV